MACVSICDERFISMGFAFIGSSYYHYRWCIIASIYQIKYGRIERIFYSGCVSVSKEDTDLIYVWMNGAFAIYPIDVIISKGLRRSFF